MVLRAVGKKLWSVLEQGREGTWCRWRGHFQGQESPTQRRGGAELEGTGRQAGEVGGGVEIGGKDTAEGNTQAEVLKVGRTEKKGQNC